MSTIITKVEIKYEHDVVYARQRARLIAELLGFDRNDQTRISTAASEICRNAYLYGKGGDAEFMIEGNGHPQAFIITVKDRGDGIKNIDAILEGRFKSETGMGLGIIGTKRLMDHFHIETGQGTTVLFGKTIPLSAPVVTIEKLCGITETLIQTRPESPLEEIRVQNQDILRAMDELQKKQEELIRLNQELEDTNRGVLSLYTELDEKAVQLTRANELKNRFLSNMSHEFKTPLNSIIAISRLLLDRMDGELTDEQEKQVLFIRKGAEELSALVNDLLDLAKIEAGKIAVHARECNAAEIFSGLRGMIKPMLMNESLDLVFEDTESIPFMVADDGKVSQILRNFISNAIKFTEKGEIRVSAKLNGGGKAVIFSVSDTGIGISTENQAKIFNDYVQAGIPVRKDIKGTGLGLSISKRLAEMLGGSVGVESRLGMGSTFFLTLPLKYIDQTEIIHIISVDITKHPILVIEDDPTCVFLYEKYFKNTAFQIFHAESIAKARFIMKKITPKTIILDLLLPGENTWNYLMELKSSQETRSIPVVIASILNEQEKGMALGADDYCVKPVDRKCLIEKLDAFTKKAPIEKILIIDDEDVARYIMKGHLASTKYKITEASDGKSGIEKAVSEKPDIIFLDLLMPGMTGFEVLKELKTNERTKTIPVIISTSKVLEEDERQLLNTQAAAILSKNATSREAAISSVTDAITRAFGFEMK